LSLLERGNLCTTSLNRFGVDSVKRKKKENRSMNGRKTERGNRIG